MMRNAHEISNKTLCQTFHLAEMKPKKKHRRIYRIQTESKIECEKFSRFKQIIN